MKRQTIIAQDSADDFVYFIQASSVAVRVNDSDIARQSVVRRQSISSSWSNFRSLK